MGLPPKLLIRLGRFTWQSMWQIMMSQMAPRDNTGAYVRPDSAFHGEVKPNSPHEPESGRYTLIVGMGCPWAHRTLVVRALKGLESSIDVELVQPAPEEGGWILPANSSLNPEITPRPLRHLYLQATPGYSGRCTVPVLWDKQTTSIVNNESSEIIVILNAAFNANATHRELDLYPDELRSPIDDWNQRIYATVNNGVYRCGFAQTQHAYESACTDLFETLDAIDHALSQHRYLCGNQITLADIRLFTTLFRFDAVYFSLFKCNIRRIQDYPNLAPYLRDLYQLPGVKETCSLEDVKRDYYGNLFPVNPGGIIPLGPDLSYLDAPHDRDLLKS